MAWTGSKRAKKPQSYCRRGERWRKLSRMKTTSDSAIAVTCRLNRALVNNGFCVIQKQRKRWRPCAIISSASFPRVGKKFTHNGSKTSAIGASADRSGGDIGYRLGTGNP